MVELISLIYAIDGSILSLAGFHKKIKIQEYDKFKKFQNNSDIITLHKICGLFRKNLKLKFMNFIKIGLTINMIILIYIEMIL